MNKIKSEQSGRSMVEMLGVLAIIGVLSVGGIAGYSKAMAKFKLSKAMDQVTTIVTNIRTLYASQPSYSDLTTEVAIRIGAIPTEMLNGVSPTSATAVYNAYSGKVGVFSSTTGSDFGVLFLGLGKEACVALLTADWGRESGSGFVAVGANSSASISSNLNSSSIGQILGNGKKDMTLSDATTLCDGTGDTNNVAWQFH
ncbi:MAG: hypothetical protein J6K16_03530 [Alphaproteobacteria bacterium]|nr:hypothetical protein [Alphaproteobacteria bacterium]